MLDFALIVPDCHIPYENQAAFDLMLRVASFLRIKVVILLGDFLDCYAFNFYGLDPTFGTPIDIWKREKECGRKRLDQLERIPAGIWIYLEGNHEIRLLRHVKKFSPALIRSNLIPTSLDLDRNRPWKYIPFDAYQKYLIPKTNIYCRHQPPSTGQGLNVAKQSGGVITMYGDTHAISDNTFINKMTDEKSRAINIGWLGNEREKVFGYVKKRPNWAMAFGLVSHLGTPHTVHIEEDSKGLFCTFGDKEYR